jgi:hypothetical protein
MKNLKPITLLLFLLIGLQSFAQSIVDGIYSSTFGNVSMTTEFDKEFPNGSIIYGDYRENGTMSGFYADFQKEIKGTFFNGSSEGKYIFLLPFTMSANKPIDAMNGFWGYTSDNKNSANANDKWNITAKTGTPINIKNATNVWSGTWNTTDGKMHLVQVGKNVTGRYKGLGTITAVYNPSSRLLKGTFLNLNNSKSGNFEFYFEGNSFKGKWGWTAAMTGGNWDGTKEVKTNKELSKRASTTNQTVANTTTQNSPIENQKNTNSDPDNSIRSIKQGLRSTTNANSNRTLKISLLKIIRGNNTIYRFEELYGFVGVEVFRVTNSQSVLVASFGNKKQYFFDTTENSTFPRTIFGSHVFANEAQFIREFQISQADWNNPNVRFEVRLWHHLKGKIIGTNRNYQKTSSTFNLNTIGVNRDNKIWVGKDYNNGENTDSIFDIDFANSRALFKVEVK